MSFDSYEDMTQFKRQAAAENPLPPAEKVNEILRSLQDIDRRLQSKVNQQLQLQASRSPAPLQQSPSVAPLMVDTKRKSKASQVPEAEVIHLSYKPKYSQKFTASQCGFLINQLQEVKKFLNENFIKTAKDKNENVAVLDDVIKVLKNQR